MPQGQSSRVNDEAASQLHLLTTKPQHLKARQEDFCKVEASLVYVVSFRLRLV